jgi:SAM-dependent methyltransferase
LAKKFSTASRKEPIEATTTPRAYGLAWSPYDAAVPTEPFYARDLARIHDEAFGHMARGGAEALLRRLAERRITSGLVVDLGCGSGITAAALTEAGFDVLGFDLSPELLEIARHRAPAARFVEASLFEAELPECVAVTAIGEIFNYAHDPRAGRRGVQDVFARVHGALRPRGLFLFDIVEPGRERAGLRRTWHEGADWTLCFEAEEDDDARRVHRRMIVFRETGAGYERTDERHELWAYPREEALADLAAAGFHKPTILGAYGERVHFGTGHAGFLAVA